MADPRDPDAAYIPADDVILRGYCGPKSNRCVKCGGTNIRTECTYCGDSTYDHHCNEGCRDCGGAYVAVVDPALAPVRDHIARVMAEGVRCPACKGSRMAAITVDPAYPCPDCSGSGYLLPSAPIEHLLDRPGSKLTAAQSAACVAWSYQSWRRGGAVLRGIAVFIESEPQGAHSWRERGNLCAHDSIGNPRTFGVWPVRNTQDCYDAVLHERYYATVNDDGSVTTPDLPTDRSHK